MFFSKGRCNRTEQFSKRDAEKYGNCHTARIAHEFDNSCDKWDCAIKCYCVQCTKTNPPFLRNPLFNILI